MANNIPCSYVEFLQGDDLNSESLKELLEADSSWVNQLNRYHQSPLFIVLKNKHCSSEIIDILLQYNSNIHYQDMKGVNCLFVALSRYPNEAVIKLLLEKGAKANIQNKLKLTPLCVAARTGSKNIVEMLIDARCPPNGCGFHGSLINCALDIRYKDQRVLTEDFLKLLIAKGGDLDSVDEMDRSPLCNALVTGKDPQIIELIMSKGGLCEEHDSPMLCVTDPRWYSTSILKPNVIRFLLKKNYAMDEKSSGGTPLQWALLRCRYKYKAIKLMVDHQSFDANDFFENHGNLLHVAVYNRYCKPSVVLLLKDRGVGVDEKNERGQTPIEVALKRCVDYRVLKALFTAGSSIDISVKNSSISLLRYALKRYKSDSSKCRCDNFTFLLKCYCLENLDFHFYGFDLGLIEHSKLLRLADECRKELKRMELQKLGRQHTLRDFASRNCCSRNNVSDCNSAIKNYNLNDLLRILSDNAFPIYFELILAKIGRVSMEDKLDEVHVYTNSRIKKINDYTSSSCAEKCIVLDLESARNIAQYLCDEDLMNFILAFFVH